MFLVQVGDYLDRYGIFLCSLEAFWGHLIPLELFLGIHWGCNLRSSLVLRSVVIHGGCKGMVLSFNIIYGLFYNLAGRVNDVIWQKLYIYLSL